MFMCRTKKRKKLDKEAVRLIFVGYEEARKAYRFLDKTTNRIVVSRDAVFLESEMNAQESVRGIEVPEKSEVILDIGGNHEKVSRLLEEELQQDD